MGDECQRFQSQGGCERIFSFWSSLNCNLTKGEIMNHFLNKIWANEEGQDVAEYSIMLAVILVIVVGTVRLIGSNAGNVFSQVGSAIQ